MIKDQERHETQSLAEIEKRIAAANANRENNLIAKGSSTKKRMLSPRSSPSANEIEARINAANFRREIYLTSKVEKAKTKRSPRINKTLFASISPNSDDASSVSSQGLSPRIKAARLEEFEVCCIAFVPDVQLPKSKPHALSLTAIPSFPQEQRWEPPTSRHQHAFDCNWWRNRNRPCRASIIFEEVMVRMLYTIRSQGCQKRGFSQIY